MTKRKIKAPKASDPNTINIDGEPGKSREALIAKVAVIPAMTAALVSAAFSRTFGEVDVTATHDALLEQATRVHDGDMRGVESTLVAQAAALNSIFTDLARSARRVELLSQFEAHLKLALRAQNQCRMTLETLATIKNPPVVFAKQANIANNQQVNNGETHRIARAGETGNKPNEQSRIGHDQGQSLDGGTLQGANGSCASLEAVAAVNRPKDHHG